MDTVLKNINSFVPSSNLLNRIIVLTHIVGVIGLSSKWSEIFIAITPIHLMLVFGILSITQAKFSKSFILFLASTVSISYSIELIGVNTGSIFGNYEYGKALGFKVGKTPLLIGILWFTLVYSIGIMLSNLKWHLLLKSMAGALLMVFIDVFIEPVASIYDFWKWENGIIPIQNYMAWFFISFLFLIGFNLSSFEKSNPTAKFVYFSQLIFFIALNLVALV